MGRKAIGDEASVPTSLFLRGGVVVLTASSQPMSFWAGYCGNDLALAVESYAADLATSN